MKIIPIISFFLLFATAGCQTSNTKEVFVVSIVNPGFEESASRTNIPGWQMSQHGGSTAGIAYEMAIDLSSPATGLQSLRVTRRLHEDFGLVHQRLAVAPNLAGKSVTFSAMLKSKNVGPEGWLLVVNMHNSGTLLKPAAILKQVRSNAITGTTDWQHVKVDLIIPPETTSLDIGFLLLDEGTGWGDEALLTIN